MPCQSKHENDTNKQGKKPKLNARVYVLGFCPNGERDASNATGN